MIDPMPASGRARRVRGMLRDAATSVNAGERLTGAVRRMRARLPGDEYFGDPLSTGRHAHLAVANRQLEELTDGRPGVLRELGLGALQVWQSLLESRGRDVGDVEVTVVFTDLVGFSAWALKAGDDDTLHLLRAVAIATEPAVERHGGRVVKRLGDGMMAVFADPQQAFDAIVDMRDALDGVHADGYRPRIRAGMHTGRPRRLGGDYLGVDVNIAARVAQKAAAGQLLASAQAAERLDQEGVERRRTRKFTMKRAKGVPDELEVFALAPRD